MRGPWWRGENPGFEGISVDWIFSGILWAKLGIWHDMTIPTNMVTEVLSAWNILKLGLLWLGTYVLVEEQQIFGRFKCMFPHLNRDDASFCGLVLGGPSLKHSNNQRTIVSNDDCSVIAGSPRCSLRSHIDVQGKLART
jgi:hypothetical protein